MQNRFLVISSPSSKAKMYFPANRLLKIEVSDASPRQAVPIVALAFEGRLGVTLNLKAGAEPDKIATELINNLQREDYLIYVRSDDIEDIS
jgi:hypothetical protein